MKPPALLFVVLAAALVRADDSALVKAAKKIPPGTVITNETVKKDAVAAGSTTPATTTAAAPPRNPFVVQAEQRQQRVAAETRLHDAEQAAARLERELAVVELSYYDESDPDVRDREITKRFALTRERLEAAKKELTGARAAVAALPPSNVTVIP